MLHVERHFIIRIGHSKRYRGLPGRVRVDWITGIVFDKSYVILCVYMPYECHVNEADYVEKLGVLQSILSELDTTCVSILGDWNADISDDSSILLVI